MSEARAFFLAEAGAQRRKSSFAPVVDRDVRVLVLGSLPGEVSLARSQYYAHPQNRFWQLMSEVIDVALPGLGYTDRLEALLASGVGLWDVVAEAQRQGSLDSSIRDRADNDLVALVLGLPRLSVIAFNGGTAGRIGRKILGSHADAYELLQLPSSSPAYTLSYAEKLRAWCALREWTGGGETGRRASPGLR